MLASPGDADAAVAAARLIGAAYLLGMEHARRDTDGERLIEAADGIPPVPFAEAAEFLRTKIPVTKKEWDALEPQVRFRAFTAARLTTADYVARAKDILAKSAETGAGYAETWRQLSDQVGDDALSVRPGYWENVYRTNTQSAYVAGKLRQLSDSPPAAIRLLVIDDSRTSAICRRLLRRGSPYGMTLSADHPFWAEFGYPPYHYQCRTGIQAVTAADLSRGRATLDRPEVSALRKQFAPQPGFGGDPLAAGSWWRMPRDMAVRAAEHGVFGEVEAFARKNGLRNFALGLVDGSDLRNLQGTKFNAEKAARADPLQKEVAAAKILVEKGHSVYFTPVNTGRGVRNPDGIIDGHTADFKVLTSRKIDKIEDRIKECDRQGVQVACVVAPADPEYTRQQAARTARNVLERGYASGGARVPLKAVKMVYLVYGDTVSVLKK